MQENGKKSQKAREENQNAKLRSRFAGLFYRTGGSTAWN